ncbi:MAG TPA: phosphatidate cytidylyltransferase [Acidobacteriota bacterium]|nr:phosphatidate cytidylyltransferase [Acidobacteriota bacterium]
MKTFLIRLAVAVVAIPALLWILHRGDIWLDVVMALFILLGAVEIQQMTTRIGVNFSPLILSLLAVLAAIIVWPRGGDIWVVWLVLTIVAPASTAIWRRSPKDAAAAWAVQAGGIVWLGVGFGALGALRLIGPTEGFRWLLFLFANLWLGDTAAYLFGVWLGRRPLAPAISPKKTVAGAVAQLLISAAIGLVFAWAGWLDAPPVLVMVAAVVVGAVAQIGDLFESILKRAAGVKDSSAIIPGHGGVLDRFDSTLFAAPTLWALIHLWPR